jgi:hypothetical protein
MKFPKYTSIQLTFPAKSVLKRKKKDTETYEEYLRRVGVL